MRPLTQTMEHHTMISSPRATLHLPVRTPSPNVRQPQPTPGMEALRIALAVSRVHHTLSMAHRLGIYPA